jgi:hypothetical protein
LSQAELLASLPELQRNQVLSGLSEAQFQELAYDWRFWGRPEQLPPDGDWLTWLVLAGRGFGKTRLGAEFVREEVAAGGASHIAIIAETAADARGDWEGDVHSRLRPFRFEAAGSGAGSQGRNWKGPGYDLAEAAADLIAAGQSEEWVFELTPRQLAAHAFLAERRRIRGLVDGITAATMGARVKKEALEGELKKLEKEL